MHKICIYKLTNLIIDNGGGVRLIPVPPAKKLSTMSEDRPLLKYEQR